MLLMTFSNDFNAVRSTAIAAGIYWAAEKNTNLQTWPNKTQTILTDTLDHTAVNR